MFGHTYTPSGSTKGHSQSDPIVVKPPDSQSTPAVQVIVVSARFWLHWTLLLVKEANLYSLAPLLNKIWNTMVVWDNSSLPAVTSFTYFPLTESSRDSGENKVTWMNPPPEGVLLHHLRRNGSRNTWADPIDDFTIPNLTWVASRSTSHDWKWLLDPSFETPASSLLQLQPCLLENPYRYAERWT